MRSRLGTKRITLADSTHGICSSCCLRWASGTKKMLRPISPPITSMICACATCCGAGDFNLIAGINAKTPGVLAVAVEAGAGSSQNRKNDERQARPTSADSQVFFGRDPRRTETRFCPRRNGDSCSASRSTSRASSKGSRSGASVRRETSPGSGYNSSCIAVELDFRATLSSQLSTENR